ncbi:MAG TPA: M3 family metallopeptidase, partial [Edaphobacter sp.]
MFAKTNVLFVCLLSAALCRSQEMPKSQPPIWSGKPDVAAFERSENQRLAAAQAAIERLVSAKGSRTIENTLVPYDEAIRQLNAAAYLSGLMQQVHPDAAFRDSATTMTTKVSGARTSLSLNPAVYQALAALDLSKTDPATRYYIQRQLLEFRLAGVDKDDATRAQIKKLQDELTEAQSHFDRNISDGKLTIELDSVADLDGLPQDFIDRHKPGADGKIRVTTDYPDFFPVMTYAKSDTVRRRLSEAFSSRAYPKNRDVLLTMMRTSYEIARLNGYQSWADYAAADRMIGSGGNIAAFLQELSEAVRPASEREYVLLLAEKKKDDPGATLIYGYQRMRLNELVRRSQYNFDSESVRPYFPYNEIKQGVFNTASALFHVEFRQEPNAPAWDPSVETWDVIDKGKAIGRMYLDMHPRKGKYSHAEESPVLDGIRGKQLAEAALVCNFPAPTADDPGLMQIDDVTIFFHE